MSLKNPLLVLLMLTHKKLLYLEGIYVRIKSYAKVIKPMDFSG